MYNKLKGGDNVKKSFWAFSIIYILLFVLITNSFLMLRSNLWLLFLLVPAFLLINSFAGFFALKTKKKRLKALFHGAVLLLVFEISAAISVIFHVILAFQSLPDSWQTLLWSALISVLTHAVLFWNGIICVYCTSVQLGIKHRVVGAVCGMIPVANLVVLNVIINVVFKEALFEAEKDRLNLSRKDDEVCKTKYPILFVHGVFFRDSKFFNYWGRIPKELESNGAKVYYGNHQSAASIAESADELTERIKRITSKTGCEKVNIIAHSKGGLDCRYAISKLDAAPFVASLTTVNTPHRGCLFADYLLTKIPEKVKNKVASVYNSTLEKFGDISPDFLAAVNDLTASSCEKLDCEMPAPDGIYCQSIGSVINKASGGKFPLNFSYHLVRYFDGANDGLVSESSFKWSDNYTLITPSKKRGVSHGDMIDLNRENIDGFDVREFYVNLVADLKNRGL